MAYKDCYLDLDPTYHDAYGRPMLRMTFDWKENEIKASQYLVGKLKNCRKTLNPTVYFGGRQEAGRSLQHHPLSEYPHLWRRDHGR